MNQSPEARQEAATNGERLDSWKEISEYLKRDVRTVQRWEKSRGLPVHRVPGGGHAAVYALKPELDAWLGTGPAPAASANPRRKLLVGIAAAAIVLLAAGATFLGLRRSTPVSVQAELTRLTWDSGLTTDPALSPDGKLLAYASNRGAKPGAKSQLDIWCRQLSGHESIRLTDDPADDNEPIFSPDGSQIAFRSERNPPGIYVVPALGGAARLLVPDGRAPRFSPDGKSIAYYMGERHGTSKIGVAPVGAGKPKIFDFAEPELAVARFPVWSPDGTRLLFASWRDWWVLSLDTGTAKPADASAVFLKHGLDRAGWHIPALWIRDRIVFSQAFGDNTNLWQLPISSQEWRITGAPERLTSSTGFNTSPTLSAGGQLAFTSLAENIDIWSLPIDSNRAAPTGESARLTSAEGADLHPAISADGRRIAFRTNRTGKWDVWTKELETGDEKPLATGTATGAYISMTPDGAVIGFQNAKGYNKNDYLAVEIHADGTPGPIRKACADCDMIYDLSADRKRMLMLRRSSDDPPRRSMHSVSVDSGQNFELIHHDSYNMADPRFSPDSKWVAFHTNLGPTRRRIFVFPVRPGVPESEWIPVTDGEAIDREVAWSPDGNILYWISERDGFRCLAGRRLDPVTKHPHGEMFYVLHLHGLQRTMMHFYNPNMGRPAVARDKIVFSLAERTGNIWMMELPKRK